MLLTERLQNLGREVESLRRSFTIHDARSSRIALPNDGITRRDQRVGLHKEAMPQVLALAQLIRDVQRGSRPDWYLKEAMGTSDFPLLFGDLLYRQLLGNYVPYPTTYQNYFRQIQVTDFRKINLYTLEGGTDILPQVREHEPYPEAKFVESRYQASVLKYGRRYGISFEMLINDDLNAFSSRPQAMAIGARRSEEYLATTMLCDADGPHASFFTEENENLITGPLTIPNLQTAYKSLGEKKDSDGNPIVLDMVHLVTTPGNEIVAQNIMNALELRLTGAAAGAAEDTMIVARNWMAGRLKLSINPYIKIVAANATAEPWFLIASPNNPAQRPAFVFATLRGRQQPQLFVKDPDAIMLGGGQADPTEGSFDTDSIDYKIRHIFGAAQIDPNMAMASDGTEGA